jgi:DNA primase
VATRWIDFTELKHRVSIRDVLTRYGYVERLSPKKPGKLAGACPIHGGKNSTSFQVDTEKNVFNCFSQCGGGNILDLVMKIEKCGIREAGEKLADWFELRFERKRKGDTTETARPAHEQSKAGAAHSARPVDAPRVNPPLERPLRDLNPDHPYLATRGLTIPTIKTFGIGHCTRGLLRGRIAIPIDDDQAVLVAFAGRAVKEDLAEGMGKYRLPEGFKKSFVLFNLHRAKTFADRGVVIVEGFFDCFKVHQAGFPNVVALMGSTLSDHQEQLLLAHTDRLSLMFDGDDAGTKCLREFYGRLRQRIYLREIHLEAGEQPDRLSEDRIRKLLS